MLKLLAYSIELLTKSQRGEVFLERMSNKVSVIIVTYNHRKYMGNCLSSVLANNPLEVIVVDNDSAEFIKENFPQVKLIKNSKNLGYSGGNNLGVRHAKGKYELCLNPKRKWRWSYA